MTGRKRAWPCVRLVLLACILLPGGCERPEQRGTPTATAPATRPAGQKTLQVFVSILPQAYFVERVGGPDVSVQVLVMPGQSPATYSPTPRQMMALERADVFFTIGVPFEQALRAKIEAGLPDLLVVDSSRGVQRRWMASHDHDGGHDHAAQSAPSGRGTPDPHIWLDPRRVKTIAANMCETLCELRPARCEFYRRNLETFQAELDRLDTDIRQRLAGCRGRALFVFHPAYGYFADAYGLRQVAVEIEGKSPGPRQVARLVEQARAAGAKAILVQPQFSKQVAEVVAREIGGRVIEADPLARDYLTNMRRLAEQIAAAVGEQTP